MRHKKFKSIPLGRRSDDDLKKITSRTLRKDIELLTERLRQEQQNFENWKINKPKYLQYRLKFDKLFAEKVSPIKQQIQALKNDRKNYKSALGLFKTSKLSNAAFLKLQELENLVKANEDKIKKELGEVAYCPDTYNINNIVVIQNQISRYQTYLDKKLKKEEQFDLARGLAATVTKKSRDLADEVKCKILRNEYCPYCGDKLLDNCHADHIYPISKGGLSVPKNMVYVCRTCNIKKGSLTLTAFIKKYKFDRDYIERNLELLNKEF